MFPATRNIVEGHDMQPQDQIPFMCIKAYAFNVRFIAESFGREVVRAFEKIREEEITSISLVHRYAREAATWAFEHISRDRVILASLLASHVRAMDWNLSDFNLEVFKELPLCFVRRMLNIEWTDGEKRQVCRYLKHTNKEDQAKCAKRHMRYDEVCDQAIWS